MTDELNAMEELAKAAYYIGEACRGVPGEFEVEEEGWGEGDFPRALQELHKCQIALHKAGYRRDPIPERFAPVNLNNVEVAVYKKRFPSGNRRWVVITVTVRFGLHARVTCMDHKPWA